MGGVRPRGGQENGPGSGPAVAIFDNIQKIMVVVKAYSYFCSYDFSLHEKAYHKSTIHSITDIPRYSSWKGLAFFVQLHGVDLLFRLESVRFMTIVVSCKEAPSTHARLLVSMLLFFSCIVIMLSGGLNAIRALFSNAFIPFGYDCYYRVLSLRWW